MSPSINPTPAKLTFRSALRHCITLLTLICAIAGMVVAIVALLPAFDGQELSRKGLEVTDWTAKKDFWDHCQAEKEAGVSSPECESIKNHPLPVPPRFALGSSAHQLHSRAHPRDLASTAPNGTSSSHSLLVVVAFLLLSVLILVIVLRATSPYEPPRLAEQEELDMRQSRPRTASHIPNYSHATDYYVPQQSPPSHPWSAKYGPRSRFPSADSRIRADGEAPKAYCCQDCSSGLGPNQELGPQYYADSPNHFYH